MSSEFLLPVEHVAATPSLVPLMPEYPPCWINAATFPEAPKPYPFTAYDLGEVLKPYVPPVYLTKADPPPNEGKKLLLRRGKKVSPLTIIAFKLLQKLPEVRPDANGNLIPAGVALFL